MTKYQVKYEKRAQKAMKKMDKHQAEMIKMNKHQAGIIITWIKNNSVETTNPRKNEKSLSANRAGEWRYRIDDYRVISHIDDKKVTILVLEIGHRREIYK